MIFADGERLLVVPLAERRREALQQLLLVGAPAAEVEQALDHDYGGDD